MQLYSKLNTNKDTKISSILKQTKVMKAVKINTANPQNLVNALVALNARFVYGSLTL